VSGEQVTVASFNTRGVPVTGSYLARRYAVIGAEFDAGDADVVCFQEVLSYWHLPTGGSVSRLRLRVSPGWPGAGRG